MTNEGLPTLSVCRIGAILGLSPTNGLAFAESGRGNLQAGTRGNTNKPALWFTANHGAATVTTAEKDERKAMSKPPKNGGYK